MLTAHAFNLAVLAQAAQPAGPEQETAAAPLLAGWMVGIIVILVIGVPFLLGSFIGRSLKMKDQSFKISVILFALTLGIAPFVAQYVIGGLESRRYNAELATWEAKKDAYGVTAEGVAKLKEKNEGLTVVPRKTVEN